MSKPTLAISGRTVGGCNFISRVFRHHAKHGGNVDVVVNIGSKQDYVYRAVQRDLQLLHDHASINFTVTVTKEVP